MAKKLNKKVAIISVIIIVLVLGAGMGVLIGPKVARRLGIGQNPEKSLEKAHQLLEAGDYENAEKEFGLAYAYGKTDAYKIERLFELANFHLIHNEQHEADWMKARRCWNQIVKIDPDNVEAQEKLLDFMTQAAEAGDDRIWKTVNEQTTELLAVLERKGIEPDTSLLITHAKSLLLMAQRGETTNRRELLNDSLTRLDALVEKSPRNPEIYSLRAQATILQGELDQNAGIRNALETSREKAFEWLEKGIAACDDKATATANLLMLKLQTIGNDPDGIDNLRAEIEKRTADLTPNDKLMLVTSIAYENTGNMSVEAELNRAIEAIRQASKLDPENVEYVIRMYRLLYRKGSALNDPAAVADAIELAEEALLMPGTQDIPGPLQGRNRQYRMVVQSFLAEAYLEKAIQANRENDEEASRSWQEKAAPHVQAVKNFIGTTENPIVQKFDGMTALAEGDRIKATRLLYTAYEYSKTLDKEGQPSDIDPVLCLTLADMMKQTGQLGMQREFLEKAIFNRKRPVLQKPEILLDYAEILAKLRGWTNVLDMVNSYQGRYGINTRSQTLKTQAQIALDQLDEAGESLSIIPEDEPLATQLRINLLTRRIVGVQQSAFRQDAERTELTAEQTQQVAQLRAERSAVLGQWLAKAPETVDAQTLMEVCRDMIQNDQIESAVAMLDDYLAAHPEAVAVKVLKLQAMTENPRQITQEENFQIQQQALQSISDPVTRLLSLAQLHRNRGDYEKAITLLEEISQTDTNSQVLGEKFDIALQLNDVQTAENLLRSLRAQNVDGCEGGLFSAQLEFTRENYPLALRRLEECLAIQPLSSQIYFLRSRIFNAQEDHESAVTALQKALQIEPLNPTYARNLASVLFTRNTKLGSKVTPQQTSQAQQAITQAMVLNPTDVQLQSVYAETISEQNPDQALSIRQLLLKNHPTVQHAIMLGNMAARQARSEWNDAKKTGLIELAKKSYQQAMEMDPDNVAVQQLYAEFLPDEQAVDLLKDDENLLWKYYLRNSQFEQALEVLNTLHEKNPDDVMVIRGLALTAEGMGDRVQVKQHLDAISQLDDSKETELWLFQKYLDNGFTADVENKLPGFKERYPQEAIALLIEAWVQMSNGHLEDSLALTNRYLETETENASAWRLRGRLYRLMNQPQRAIGDLQRSKRIQADPMVRLELASVYNETGNPQGAIGELKEGLNDPQAPAQLRLSLEAIYRKTNNLVELENFYLETLEKYPQNVFWLYRIGSFYQEQKNYAKAQAFLKKAWDLGVEQNNQDINVLIAYLDSLYEGGRNDDAFSLASEFIDTPAAAAAYTYMALIQLKLNQASQAGDSFVKALEKAGTNDRMQEMVLQQMLKTVGKDAVESWYNAQLSQNPQSLPAHLLAFRLAQREERYNTAIEHLDRCIDILGEDHAAWLSVAIKKGNVLILAYTKTADQDYLDRSIQLFEAMLKKQPGNPSLLNNLAYLLVDNNKQVETALGYARKAHQSDPSNAIYLDTYAYALCKTGQYGEAERNLLRAIQLNEVAGIPIPWDMYKHLGMAYEGQGENRRAADHYQKSLEIAADIPAEEKQFLQEKIEQLKQ